MQGLNFLLTSLGVLVWIIIAIIAFVIVALLVAYICIEIQSFRRLKSIKKTRSKLEEPFERAENKWKKQIEIPLIGGKLVGKLNNQNYYEFKTGFVDDVNDGLMFYYGLDSQRFTDDHYLEFEFECRGLDLAQYRERLNKLLIRFNAEISEEDNSLISYKEQLDGDSLAFYCQALIFCYDYLSILVLPESIRNAYFSPVKENKN